MFLDPLLARTLERIRDAPLDMYTFNALSNESLAADIVADVRDAGGILSLEDLTSYSVLWKQPIECPLAVHRGDAAPANLTLYTMRPESRHALQADAYLLALTR